MERDMRTVKILGYPRSHLWPLQSYMPPGVSLFLLKDLVQSSRGQSKDAWRSTQLLLSLMIFCSDCPVAFPTSQTHTGLC